MPDTVSLSRLGHTGVSRWGGDIQDEFLDELKGHDKKVKVYREMSRNDAVISAVIFAVTQLMKTSNWTVEMQEDSQEHEEAAVFLKECLEDLQTTWDQLIDEWLSFLIYGWSYNEIIFLRRNGDEGKWSSKFDDGKIGIYDITPRGQSTLEEWDLSGNGEIKGMTQSAPPDYKEIYIPIEKALHFTTGSRRRSPEGISILRHAYRSYFFKKTIQELEGIGIERDLAGIPTLTAPSDINIWDESDEQGKAYRKIAEELVVNLRQDEMAGVVLPDGWNLKLLSSAGKKQFDPDTVIKRYAQREAVSVLADFLLLGSKKTGSYAMSVSKQALFERALDGWLDAIAQGFNNQVAERLFDINDFNLQNPPKLVPDDIKSPPLDELGNYIRRLSQAGIDLFPDEELEDELRSRASLPEQKRKAKET